MLCVSCNGGLVVLEYMLEGTAQARQASGAPALIPLV